MLRIVVFQSFTPMQTTAGNFIPLYCFTGFSGPAEADAAASGAP